jgi:regulator of sigma E protease
MISLLNILVFILSFLMLITFLVYFHELGHYLTARLFKVKVEKFSIGFGKPLLQWKSKNGTIWSLGRIPLGGYVKFFEIDNQKNDVVSHIKNNDKLFTTIPVFQRMLVVLAGPIFNFILTIFIFAGLSFTLGSYKVESIVGIVVEGSPADKAGFLVGDKILSMDNINVSDFNDLRRYVALRGDTDILAKIQRNEAKLKLTIMPERTFEKDLIGGISETAKIGIGLSEPLVITRLEYNLFEAIAYGYNELISSISMTGYYIGRVIKGEEDGKQLGSIIKIATISGKVAVDAINENTPMPIRLRELSIRLLTIGASLSVALGVANLMPIPMLDGGHLVYYGYEAIVGRALSQKKQEIGFQLGLAILLTLFVLLTLNDISYVSSIFLK